MVRFGLVVLGLMLFSSAASAECICQCVNGNMRPICENSLDLPPICPPAICPIMAPSIPPISVPTIPPIGTSYCQQKRVCDMFGNCQWRQICQ